MTGALSTLQIGMTVSHKHTSGTDRYFVDLLRALPALGIRVRGVVLGDPASLDDPIPGVEAFAAEGASRLRRWAGVRRSIGKLVGDAQLVVSHSTPHAFPALDRIRSRPLVVHFHGPWALEGGAEGLGKLVVMIRRLQERAVYGSAARFITLSRAFARILEQEYCVEPDKIRVIPGGVDLARFRTGCSRDEARRQLGWSRDRPTIVTVRRLVPSKGIENLVMAMKVVRRLVRDAQAIIVGTGPLGADLQRMILEHGLEGTVRLAGRITDDHLVRVYRAADLFVMPTIAFEGFGLAAIEALACGTPALVTPVGGLPEAVAALDPGLVLEGSMPGDLVDGLRMALEGKLPLPDAQACRDYAQRFAWPAIAAHVRDVYREVA